MKRILSIFLVLSAVVAAFLAFSDPVLFRDGKSSYVIALCDGASESEVTAAKELQNYLMEIGDVSLPIVAADELEAGQKHIFVGFNDSYAAEFGVERPDDEDETYVYRAVDDDIWIYGGKQRGTIYGVYSFLENEFGVRWYTTDFTKVPKMDKWSFKDLYHTESPYINYRLILYRNMLDNVECSARNKCNMGEGAKNNEYGGQTGYWAVHTFNHFVNSDKYFAEHPEYFSLRDGKRTPNTQLCLSNPDVLRLCVEGMKEVMATRPDYWGYSLSQNDNQFPCQCDKCRMIEYMYGGHSGLLLWFVNQVADAVREKYPDKFVGTLAYQYTRKPPVGIVPRNNVVIRLCSFECCFAHALEDCESNKSFLEDMQAWSKIAPHLSIWDYVVNFNQYVAPFPNFGVLAKNIKTFGKYNVISILEQGQYQTLGGEFSEMRSWVLSKLLWNPELDTMALVREFITDYYGAAAPYIQRYFDLCQSLVTEDTVMGIYINAFHPIYTDEFIAEAKALLEQAKAAVAQTDEKMRLRIDLVGLQIDWLRMVRTPKESLEDGTSQRLFDLVRKNNIRMTEWHSIEQTIKMYDVKQ